MPSSKPSSMQTQAHDPLSAYNARLKGGLTPDPAQREVVKQLQTLHHNMRSGSRRSWYDLFRGKTEEIRGLYIWGNVGRGKSMLMDLFFTHAPVTEKRRVHFHRFMQEVHARIHEIRQEHAREAGDPVAILVQELAAKLRLLCFDELQATDVADATLLYRLFDGLFERGVVIVSTSNHPPESLYTGGVQKERFERWIALINEHMKITGLSSPNDYRTQQLKALHEVYHAPLGPGAEQFVREAVQNLAPGALLQIRKLMVHGRELKIRNYGGDVALASFGELCEQALGAADYLALADEFKTLILTDVPVLSPEKRNEAKRFVTLVDALYEQKTKLVMTASALPTELYPSGDGSFEFKRTVSRLMEMQSKAYLDS